MGGRITCSQKSATVRTRVLTLGEGAGQRRAVSTGVTRCWLVFQKDPPTRVRNGNARSKEEKGRASRPSLGTQATTLETASSEVWLRIHLVPAL